MNLAVQLDECINSSALRRHCAECHGTEANSFPSRLLGNAVKDDEMLAEVLTDETPLFTIDSRLPHDHADSIPESHPGVIVAKGKSRPLTATRTKRILEAFKSNVPLWNELDPASSVLIISFDRLTIGHATGGKFVVDRTWKIDEVKQEEVEQVLSGNRAT